MSAVSLCGSQKSVKAELVRARATYSATPNDLRVEIEEFQQLQAKLARGGIGLDRTDGRDGASEYLLEIGGVVHRPPSFDWLRMLRDLPWHKM